MELISTKSFEISWRSRSRCAKIVAVYRDILSSPRN